MYGARGRRRGDAFRCGRLTRARSAERMKNYWGEKLAVLKIELGRS